MKISPVKSITKYNYCAGKTQLYTDFDGTYFPSNQYFVMFKYPSDISMLQKMYSGFQGFFNIAKEQFETIITTGRDMFDFKRAIDIFQKSNVTFPQVQGYVFGDGLMELKDSSLNLNSVSMTEEDFPNKLYQPKAQVKRIVENNSNDLIIVAGNDWNDVDMLNPLNYLDVFNIEYNRCIDLEDLLNQEDILDALRKMPLVSIVSGNSKNIAGILKIKHILDKKGIYKIFYAKNPETELLKRIKQGMYIYSQDNEEYRNNLNPLLLNEIA